MLLHVLPVSFWVLTYPIAVFNMQERRSLLRVWPCPWRAAGAGGVGGRRRAGAAGAGLRSASSQWLSVPRPSPLPNSRQGGAAAGAMPAVAPAAAAAAAAAVGASEVSGPQVSCAA